MVFRVIFVIGAIGSAAHANTELRQQCVERRRQLYQELDRKLSAPGVEGVCAHAVRTSREKCEGIPEDPGFKKVGENAGAPEVVDAAIAANREAAGVYRKHAEGCRDASRELSQTEGQCGQELTARRDQLTQLFERRSAAIGKPEFSEIERQYNELKASIQATDEARRAASDANSLSQQCDEVYAALYDQATDELENHYRPLVATGSASEEAAKAAADAAAKRALTAAARTSTAHFAKEAGQAALGRGALAPLGPVACAKGDGIGCGLGLSQTAVDYGFARHIAPHVAPWVRPYHINIPLAATAIALTPTPVANGSYYYSPVGAALGGGRFVPFSAQSVNQAISILENSK